MTERMQKLQQLLERDPADPFLLFALGMEHRKANDLTGAMDFFRRALEKDPGYCVAYHQAALTQEQAGDVEAARQWYKDGIAAATRSGDAHAREEMQAALMMIE